MGKFLKRGLKYSFPNKHIPVAPFLSHLSCMHLKTQPHTILFGYLALLLSNYMIQPHLAHRPYLLNEVDKICA